MILEEISPLPEPDAGLEQYSTPAGMAAEILFGAYMEDHVSDRSVLDLGCGSGVFSLGAAFLGAEHVAAVDVDPRALETLRKNGRDIEAPDVIRPYLADVKEFEPERVYDTCIMNPPFGAQKKSADRPFLNKAMELCPIIYTIHMSDTREFITRFIGREGFGIAQSHDYRFPIPHTFSFHTRAVADVPVTCFKIERLPKRRTE